jgi:rubrerythrin
MAKQMNDEIKNGLVYVCYNCHILFYIRISNHNYKENISLPDKTYRYTADRPKSVCPKCKQENSYNIRIERD